jgi:hypothetical protein
MILMIEPNNLGEYTMTMCDQNFPIKVPTQKTSKIWKSHQSFFLSSLFCCSIKFHPENCIFSPSTIFSMIEEVNMRQFAVAHEEHPVYILCVLINEREKNTKEKALIQA